MDSRVRRKFIQTFLILICLFVCFVPRSFSAEKIVTKVVVRVVARDAQLIGSGVGGAHIRIKNLETGEILAEGKQEGGAGSTDRIKIRPRQRGEAIYEGSGAASFEAKIPLERPTQVEIEAEGPLAYPQSVQKGSKTMLLIPGKHITGDGVIIELNGLIVNALSPSPQESLKAGEKVLVTAEVRML